MVAMTSGLATSRSSMSQDTVCSVSARVEPSIATSVRCTVTRHSWAGPSGAMPDQTWTAAVTLGLVAFTPWSDVNL